MLYGMTELGNMSAKVGGIRNWKKKADTVQE
jgi:hypothetical protein